MVETRGKEPDDGPGDPPLVRASETKTPILAHRTGHGICNQMPHVFRLIASLSSICSWPAGQIRPTGTGDKIRHRGKRG